MIHKVLILKKNNLGSGENLRQNKLFWDETFIETCQRKAEENKIQQIPREEMVLACQHCLFQFVQTIVFSLRWTSSECK